MANNNGFGAQSAAMYGGMNGSVMPSAGQYADMQLLMTTIETLSSQLESNREQMNRLQDGLVKVERKNVRTTSEGPLAQQQQQQQPFLPNGEQQSPQDQPQPPPSASTSTNATTLTQLHLLLDSSTSRIETLERALEDQSRLQHDYDTTLDSIIQRIRSYCYDQQTHISSLHAHYSALLAQARAETLDAQLTHQAWQAGLRRVSENVRLALKTREEEGAMPWRGKVAALKEENRVLRAKVGWDPVGDSEDEEDYEDFGGNGDGGSGNGNGNGGGEVAVVVVDGGNIGGGNGSGNGNGGAGGNGERGRVNLIS